MASSTAPPPAGPAESPPAVATAAAKASPVPATASAEAPQGGVFEYLDETPRTYTPSGLPPQTAERGDVCELGWTPTDGNWRPSTKAVTRWPDPQYGPGGLRQPPHDPTLVAHSLAEHEAILERLGLTAEGGEQR